MSTQLPDDVLTLSVAEYAVLLEKHHGITMIDEGQDSTAKSRMLACKVYDCNDLLLVLERQRGNEITALLNTTTQNSPQELHKRQALIHLLTNGNAGKDCWLEPPVQVDYGSNIVLGDGVIMNFNGVALDCAKISTGDRTMMGPGAQLFGATHPLNPLLRNPLLKFDYAMSITIGKDCWIGGGSTICPGVTIGDGVVVGAGSVVTKNVPPYVVVAGSPARVIRELDQQECAREEREYLDFLEDGGSWELWFRDWTPEPKGTLKCPTNTRK